MAPVWADDRDDVESSATPHFQDKFASQRTAMRICSPVRVPTAWGLPGKLRPDCARRAIKRLPSGQPPSAKIDQHIRGRCHHA
jgi:hypothetical protein